jgi:hypothetical protein
MLLAILSLRGAGRGGGHHVVLGQVLRANEGHEHELVAPQFEPVAVRG